MSSSGCVPRRLGSGLPPPLTHWVNASAVTGLIDAFHEWKPVAPLNTQCPAAHLAPSTHTNAAPFPKHASRLALKQERFVLTGAKRGVGGGVFQRGRTFRQRLLACHSSKQQPISFQETGTWAGIGRDIYKAARSTSGLRTGAIGERMMKCFLEKWKVIIGPVCVTDTCRRSTRTEHTGQTRDDSLSRSHPKVYSNGGYKVASQKCAIFKAHQDARLSHGRVSEQHHLEQTHDQREGQQVTASLTGGNESRTVGR